MTFPCFLAHPPHSARDNILASIKFNKIPIPFFFHPLIHLFFIPSAFCFPFYFSGD